MGIKLYSINLLFALPLLVFDGCDRSESQLSQDKSCPFDASGISVKIDCGYLEVPENRSNPNGRKIEIAYAVIKSKDRHAGLDPVVYLMGGPGGSSLNNIRYWSRHAIVEKRDMILVDQRGTGFSRPNLCPEVGLETVNVMAEDFSPEEEYKRLSKLAMDCKTSLIASGIDLGSFNSKENAADLEELRIHLGHEKWNLYGGSYGTRLALTMMRDYPDGIRSVILSGPFPPNANMYAELIPNFDQSLSKFFRVCQENPACHNKYPGLQDKFRKIIPQLIDKPVTFEYQGQPFVINAQDALLIIHQLLYSRNTLGQVPGFIEALKSKDQEVISKALKPLLQRSGAIDMGMYFSVQAFDELPFNGASEYAQSLEELDDYKPGLAFFNSDVRILPEWHDARADETENLPVESDIPTLILVGQLDPVTPPSYAALTAATLPNSYLYEFPLMSHNLFSYCPTEVFLTFLDNPFSPPESSCTKQLPHIKFK